MCILCECHRPPLIHAQKPHNISGRLTSICAKIVFSRCLGCVKRTFLAIVRRFVFVSCDRCILKNTYEMSRGTYWQHRWNVLQSACRMRCSERCAAALAIYCRTPFKNALLLSFLGGSWMHADSIHTHKSVDEWSRISVDERLQMPTSAPPWCLEKRRFIKLLKQSKFSLTHLIQLLLTPSESQQLRYICVYTHTLIHIHTYIYLIPTQTYNAVPQHCTQCAEHLYIRIYVYQIYIDVYIYHIHTYISTLM